MERVDDALTDSFFLINLDEIAAVEPCLERAGCSIFLKGHSRHFKTSLTVDEVEQLLERHRLEQLMLEREMG